MLLLNRLYCGLQAAAASELCMSPRTCLCCLQGKEEFSYAGPHCCDQVA